MKAALVLASLALTVSAQAADVTVSMQVAGPNGAGASVGTVRIFETPHGLAFHPSMTGLAPGLHGFHVHENPNCAPAMRDGAPVAALAAGGHLDTNNSRKHGLPWGDGHIGDLPALYVAADGSAMNPVLAPRLKLSDVRNRSVMVHAGGDNHADHPEPLGGGGARVACGVVR
jgi:superoxide dismutase, Cu-Zn family